MMCLIMSVHYSPLAPHAREREGKKGTLIAICSNAPCHNSDSVCRLHRWPGVIAVLLIADGLEHKVTREEQSCQGDGWMGSEEGVCMFLCVRVCWGLVGVG